jgi:hypothetical protein
MLSTKQANEEAVMETITIEEFKADKIFANGSVYYAIKYPDGVVSWVKISMNGKIKHTRAREITKIMGEVTLKIENDPIYGQRLANNQ